METWRRPAQAALCGATSTAAGLANVVCGSWLPWKSHLGEQVTSSFIGGGTGSCSAAASQPVWRCAATLCSRGVVPLLLFHRCGAASDGRVVGARAKGELHSDDGARRGSWFIQW